ncbi:hypothetical protein HPP92_011948 [Vanilla planifolia]|uniref:Glyoxal oxidase N-terminal domain-containing protein n=1 Tax=Vanilla planifolia TaxID=51239 RepID=A0A835V2A4_VANPL|nr:hypothetical protein HPP92_011948 [Vanilla planifolia]
MPLPRVMGDMVLLPTGDVLIINGASAGTAGAEMARKPVLNPILYRPGLPTVSRFVVVNYSPIPRLYGSTAALDTYVRVLVGGSNPHDGYVFSDVSFPTDLSIEAFHPPDPQAVEVVLVAPTFVTHSVGMNQRAVALQVERVESSSPPLNYDVEVRVPPSPTIAPPGYYMLFVVHAGVPSEAVWGRDMSAENGRCCFREPSSSRLNEDSVIFVRRSVAAHPWHDLEIGSFAFIMA